MTVVVPADRLAAQPDLTPGLVTGAAGLAIGVPANPARIESMRWRARIVSAYFPAAESTCSRPLVTSTPRSAPFQR
jgi:hypothetical protein